MADIELTTKQAAKELGVTARTISNWCNAGKLVARKEAGKFGDRWLVSAQSVREKRSEASAEAGRGSAETTVSRQVLEELRRSREENAEYREHLERLTILIEQLQQTMQRLLPAAEEQRRPSLVGRAWRWLQGG